MLIADPRTPSTQHPRVLAELAFQHGWNSGAEIGVFRGRTLRSLLLAVPSLCMIGVDRWEHLPPSDDPGAETYGGVDMAAVEADARARLGQFSKRCTLIKADSIEAARQVPDASLDFVFIDAAHTTAAVTADIHAWAPKVKAGGMITGHDWWWPSVAAALDATLPGWVRHEESVWSLPRNLYRCE